MGWALPIDPTVRGIHMGDITELGKHRGLVLSHTRIRQGTASILPLVGVFY